MSGDTWVTIYAICQILYFLTFVVFFYFLALPIDWVDASDGTPQPEDALPLIVMAYPVLHEDLATMHSTLLSLGWTDYPRSRYRVIAIPNSDDVDMVQALRRMQREFAFLEVMEIPPTSDPSWDVVWNAWAANPKAYWFHQEYQGRRDLSAKKTRQLIYLFYTLIEQIGTDWVLDYIDADSIPSPTHFKAAVAGLRRDDVLQATNVAGNLLDSMPASLHAFDHMCWDGLLYPHMSAHGDHPYYMLGKGLFYRASDLLEIGGFNPWTTIEDPEVGMRLWTNGRRLGVISDPLIEEVPRTIIRGIIQRNRWVCGFFQSLGTPLRRMGMPFWRRMQARLNILPLLSLPVNVVGLPTGAYALYMALLHGNPFSLWLVVLSVLNIGLYCVTMTILYVNAWRRTRFVLASTRQRVWYMIRINPVSVFIYHMIWTIPIVLGFVMFLNNLGKTWVRTQKYDADRQFAAEGADALKGRLSTIRRLEVPRDARDIPLRPGRSDAGAERPHVSP